MGIIRKIGNGALMIMKGLAYLTLFALNVMLNVAKLILLLFSLVLRLFFALVRAGTP